MNRKENLPNKICFYFPYMEDSGVPVLFYRMANELAKNNPDLEISVIDFEDGVMARNLLHLANTKLIPFEANKNVAPPDQSVLVMQSFVPYYWPKELVLKPEQKIFFWNLHPQNLIPSLLPLPRLREIPFNNFWAYKILSRLYSGLLARLRSFLKLLIEKDAISFMDSSNLNYTAKYLFFDIGKTHFIPVPATQAAEDPVLPVTGLGTTINVGWVGRLCDFKSYILVYAINQLAKVAKSFPDKKFVYHIVGDGPFLAYIKSHIHSASNLSVVFHGAIAHAKLDAFIAENFDIVTAMGTSALEGAKLAKPTILLDFSFKQIRGDYVFRMLHETKDYDLAHLITKEDFKNGNNSLLEILTNVLSDYPKYAKLSRYYFVEHHDIKNVQAAFLQRVLRTNLIYAMIDPEVMKKGRILRLYNKIRKLEN